MALCCPGPASYLLQDWCDGQGLQELLTADPTFFDEPRNLLVKLIYDPFLVSDDNPSSSVAPAAMCCMNLRPGNRHRPGVGIHMLAIIPSKAELGRRGDTQKLVQDPYTSLLEVVVDEINFINVRGLPVYDAFTGQHFNVRVKLVLMLSDLKGHQALLRYGGLGCILCSKRPSQKCNGRGKNLFTNTYMQLPDGDPLRHACSKLHDTRDMPHEPGTLSCLRYRAEMEAATRVRNLPSLPVDGEDVRPFPREYGLGWAFQSATRPGGIRRIAHAAVSTHGVCIWRAHLHSCIDHQCLRPCPLSLPPQLSSRAPTPRDRSP